MGEKVGEVYVDINLLDKKFKADLIEDKKLTKEFSQESGKAEKQNAGLGKSIVKLSAAYIGLGVAIGKSVQFFNDSIDVAIEAEETFNKFSVVFADVDKEATKAATNLSKNFGLASDEAQKLLSNTGDLLTGFGFTSESALNISDSLNQLAVDLASFTNVEGGAERASQALTSALLGEREQVKALGIVIRDSDIQARLAKKGLDKLTGTARNQAIAVETLAIAQEQSKNAIGDYARSADSAANVNRRLAARFRDLKAEVGKEISGPLAELKLAFLDSSEGGSIFGDVLTGIAQKIGQLIRGLTAIVRAINLVAVSFKEDVTNIKLFNEAATETGNKAKGLKLIAAAGFDVNKAFFLLKKEAESGDAEAQKFLETLAKKGDESQKAAQDTEKALQALSVSVARFNETEEERNKRLAEEREKTLAKLRAQRLKDAKKTNAEITKDSKKANKERLLNAQESAAALIGVTSGFLGQIGQIFSLASQNELSALEARQTKEQELLNARIEAEKQDIESAVQTRTERNNAIADLDKRLEKEAAELEEKQAIEKNKKQRKAAKQQKQLSIFQTVIDTPAAAMAAFKALAGIKFIGPALGAAAAAATTALGLKKIQLIKKQPLPQLQTGGIVEPVSGGRQVVVGEGGQPEGIVPLDQTSLTRLGSAISQGIQSAETGSISPTGSRQVIVDVDGKQFVGFIRSTVQQGIADRNIVITENNLSTVT